MLKIKLIIKNSFRPLLPFLIFIGITLLALTLSRILLMLWQFDRISATNGWFEILIQGIRIDISTLCWLLIIPVMLAFILPIKNIIGEVITKLIHIWLAIIFSFLIFMELSTPGFITEYDLRPNRLFIEYLSYPKEIIPMLIKGHFLSTAIGVLGLFLSLYFSWKWLTKLFKPTNIQSTYWRFPALVFVVFFILFGARSTLGHRPINPAMVYFSTDPMVNSLILNSTYSVAFAAKQMASKIDISKMYGKLDIETVIKNIREFKHISKDEFIDQKLPSLSHQQAFYRGPKKNLVIILQESLGARFVGSLGGLPLTPNLDRLSKEGWYFNSMYATGTRSVRGIEAVMTGFTPTPARAVVKLDKSQSNFFTIADLLKHQGYSTQFIYGGESHFDNMKSFFLGNGVMNIHDLNDFKSPAFIGSWGASDEDLFAEADNEFNKLNQKNKPFFSLVFTSSNHDPFEFPENRITPIQYTNDQKQFYDQKEMARHQAIQYADWALGKFFEKAKKSDYWKNTIFLIIADHDARIRGGELVPIQSFHIPALIIGDGIDPQRNDYVVSQIDMPPTLLSLIGIDNENPMLGQDLTKVTEDYKGRAMMQYSNNFALLENDYVTILQPEKAPTFYHFDRKTFDLEPQASNNTESEIRALSLLLWGSIAYNNGLYRLPKTPTTRLIINEKILSKY